MNRFDKRIQTFVHYRYREKQNSLSYDNIQALLLTGDQNLWIGMSCGGLDHFDTKTGHFTHYQSNSPGNSLLNDHVAKMVNESDSGIWIKYLMFGKIPDIHNVSRPAV